MFPTTRAFLRTCMCRTFGSGSVWRLAFGVWRLAFGVRRSAFGVWRSAFGVRRLAVVGWGCSSSYSSSSSFSTLGLARGPLAVFQLAAAHLKHISPMGPIGPICRAFKRVVRGRTHATGPHGPNRGRGRRGVRVRLVKRAKRQTLTPHRSRHEVQRYVARSAG
jgi:hypothetical protein